ncbi:MAG: hypothetical protein K8L97_13430 [Anaerolineae bacterium]|nr:hypothetical protein [Anaerolineae bacterium]
MTRLGAAIASAIAIGIGLLTLIGLLMGSGIFTTLANVFLQLTVITAAVAVLIGIANLIGVHGLRLIQRKGGWLYSLVLLISLLGVLLLAVLERAGVLTGRPAPTAVLLESVQVSIESALAGLVLFALVYGALRLMRRRVSAGMLLFTLVLLVLLAGALPLPALTPLVALRDWLLAVPVSAGARGILLGIALATVVTGVRVLIGQDRSYRE